MFIIIVLLLIFDNYVCFNIDVDSPIVYVDPLRNVPSRKSSYFGYSLALYPGTETIEPWILIGAPRGNPPSSSLNPGVGFKCGIKKTCDILSSLSVGENFLKNDSWIGGSMDINYVNNRVVTCAPRQILYNEDHSDYFLKGLCFWFHANDSSVHIRTFFPSRGHADITSSPSSHRNVYYYGFAQAGFSVHFPHSDESQLLLGAPGVLNWKGNLALFEDGSESVPIASRLVRHRRSSQEFGKSRTGDPEKNVDYALSGYSVTSGHFFSKRELRYVSGAPRGHNYYGQVIIHTFNKYSDVLYINGFQFGEYFGGSVTAGDLNNDGFDDLIIGAPFHVAGKYNEGKVYVYMGGNEVNFINPSGITGRSVNGQFGHCVQFLGDINADNFGDVAIAAPYEEENSGVVYIYAGSKSGLLEDKYFQRIVGKDISTAIRGFGISISRGADIDQNTYPDLAIGAYMSGHVVLLRTSPVVSVMHSLESFVSNLDSQTEFTMGACYSFTTKKLNFKISIRRIITVDPELGRGLLKNVKSVETVNLEKGKPFCENFTVALQKSSNKFNPLVVTLSHEFVNSPKQKGVVYIHENEIIGEDYFAPKRPVYNADRSSKLQKVEIPFALGCGSDNICVASLEFDSTVDELDKDNMFVLGSNDRLTLKTTVKNVGEKAYLTQLVITMPEIVHLYSTPPACVQNMSSVVCSVDNPLEQNAKNTISLSLDMSTVNGGGFDGDILDFTVMVLTSSTNNNDDVKKLQIKLKREADVTISGKSNDQSYFYGDMEKPVYFAQRYQVEKFGSSILNEISIEINIPRTINLQKGSASNFTYLESFSGKLDDQQFICSESGIRKNDKENNPILTNSVDESLNNSRNDHSFYINCNRPEVECSKLICNVGPIASGQIATIKLRLVFNFSNVKSLLNANDVVYFGTLGLVKVINPSHFIQNGDRPDMVEVTSLFVGEGVEERVAVWIIVVSVLASLIILALLIFGLYKMGFFRRKVKEELEQLKNKEEFTEIETLEEES